jgi:hypothetical protein
MIYIRENPDPNPVEPVCDPEKFLCRTREQASDPFYYMEISLSLPKDDAQSIDDLELDGLFDQTMFKSKSETILDEIVFDQKRFQTLITNIIPQISNPPRATTTIFSPLILLAQLHDFAQNYNQRI